MKNRSLGALAAAAALGGALAARWAYRDYKAWRSLGPGGLPPTPRGWLRGTIWRLQMTDPLSTRRFIRTSADVSLLADLEPRTLPRPRIAPHPVPHRQLDQRVGDDLLEALRSLFDQKVEANGDAIHYQMSYFEKHNPAVTIQEGCDLCGDAAATHGEVAHIHPSDGSMHMVLSPTDATAILEKGWGERHGLSGIKLGIPDTYLLIYAPRSEEELGPIALILDASIAHMLASTNPRDSRPPRTPA